MWCCLFLCVHVGIHVPNESLWIWKHTCLRNPTFTFTCIYVGMCIYVHTCKGEDLEHQGAGVPGKAIHFHWDVGSVLNAYQCARGRVRESEGDDK